MLVATGRRDLRGGTGPSDDTDDAVSTLFLVGELICIIQLLKEHLIKHQAKY